MRTFPIYVFLAAAVLSAAAPARGEEPSLDEVLEAYCSARESLVSLRARFTQTKVFTLFDEREKSSGEFAFLAPDMIRWSFTEPDSTVTVINGKAAWTVLPHIRQVQKVALSGSSTDRVMSIIGFGSCGEELRRDFDITLGKGGEGMIRLRLGPVSDDISPYFSLIELDLDPSDDLPRRVVFHELSGDLLVFRFDSLRQGVPVSPDEFKLTVPDDYELIEY